MSSFLIWYRPLWSTLDNPGKVRSTLAQAEPYIELLQHVSGKGGLETANSWKETQMLQAQPALACPDPGSGMHLLLHVPTNLAPIRVYVGDGALWITTNAEWQGSAGQWRADVWNKSSTVTGQPIWTASALKLGNQIFELASHDAQGREWKAWPRKLSWDLVGGGAQPTVSGGA